MWHVIFLSAFISSSVGTVENIDHQFYPATWQIPLRQYVLLHPQYQIDVQQQNDNDNAASTENRKFVPKEIPPPIEAIKPEKEPEKHGANDKEITIQDEIPPTKPFYYVLPPLSQILYYNIIQKYCSQPEKSNFALNQSLTSIFILVLRFMSIQVKW